MKPTKTDRKFAKLTALRQMLTKAWGKSMRPYQNGQVIRMSDRQYRVAPDGSWRRQPLEAQKRGFVDRLFGRAA